MAPIDEHHTGVLLSVLSALARLELDPWLEAANLSRLSGEKAIQRLTELIAELPNHGLIARNPSTIAGRLIALLPRQITNAPRNPAGILASIKESLRSRSAALIILYLLTVTAMMVWEFL